jgi:hypothetical protein
MRQCALLVENQIDLPGVTGSFRALLPRKAMGEILKLGGESTYAAMVLFATRLRFQFKPSERY